MQQLLSTNCNKPGDSGAKKGGEGGGGIEEKQAIIDGLKKNGKNATSTTGWIGASKRTTTYLHILGVNNKHFSPSQAWVICVCAAAAAAAGQ